MKEKRASNGSAIVSALVCIAAGVYLLTSQTQAEGSFLEVLAHGIGIYFIGKGLYVGSALRMQARQLQAQEKALEMQAASRASSGPAGGLSAVIRGEYGDRPLARQAVGSDVGLPTTARVR